MKKIASLIIIAMLIASPVFGWGTNAGWQSDRRLSTIIEKSGFSISKGHTGGTTSGDSVELFTVPNGALIKEIIVVAGAPAATAGTANFNIAVGTVGNSDSDLTDSTDDDYLVPTGNKTVANVAGDLIADYDATRFATTNKSEFHYTTEDTTLYLNYLITSSETATTTATGNVYVIYEWLE